MAKPKTRTAAARPRGDRVDRLIAEWRIERPDLDTRAMAVVGRLLHLGRTMEQRAQQSLKSLQLNYTDLDVLATLRRAGKPYTLTPTALRQSVLITSGAMTACLNRLEAQGLLLRDAADDDRRSLTASLSPKGLALVERAIEVRFAEATQSVAALTTGERADLVAILRKLGQSLDAR